MSSDASTTGRRAAAAVGLAAALGWALLKVFPSNAAPPISVGAKEKWERKIQHMLSVETLEKPMIEQLITVARWMEKKLDSGEPIKLCEGKVLANLFYEPSTRTCCSFQAAMLRLGGTNITITDTKSSSVSKGESLEDTIRCLASYSDAIVLRHSEIGAAHEAAGVSKLPVLNAGDGAGEHPTQALLDLYTIVRERGKVDGLVITLAGDLKNGRTVHSLAKLLANYKVTLRFASPDGLGMPDSVKEYVRAKCPGLTMVDFTELSAAVQKADVLYMTRIQKERFGSEKAYLAVKDKFILTRQLLTKHASKDLVVMHPLPRVNEITPDVDDFPGAAYFRQMRFGMVVRMALLWLLIPKDRPSDSRAPL